MVHQLWFFLEEFNYLDPDVSPPSAQHPAPLDVHFLERESWVVINMNNKMPPHI